MNAGLALVLFAGLVVAACGGQHSVMLTEATRSDGLTALVQQMPGGGATVSQGYKVLLKTGSVELQGEYNEILKMDKGAAPTASWRSDGKLVVSAPCAQIYNFTNFSYWKPDRSDKLERIGIVLENDGVCD